MDKGFLAEKEVHKIRPLWEKVFAEDSKEFTEYYFANKAERNLVFIRTDDEKIVSMLHLTPFITGQMEPVCYIVGVATEEAYRRQGLMADLLKEALQFMWEEGQPFTFLMPANPAYYTPFQFTYVYDKPVWKLNEAVFPMHYLETAAKYEAEFHLVIKGKGSLQIKVAQEEQMALLADFANDMLKANADCYMLRNANYYKLLKKELVAQKGNLFFVELEGRIKGIFAYVCEKDQPAFQEVIVDADLADWQMVDVSEHKPMIMARILRIEEFLCGLSCMGSVDILMDVIDPVLTQNSGVYHLYATEEGGLRCKKRPQRTKKEAENRADAHSDYLQSNRDAADCRVLIEDLTAFAFGYKTAEECFNITNESAKEEILECLKQIRVLKSVFINEII
ncbi:MAG: GNAT family N-acetyltransferase [Lachnospiraceae bacterium]|nr:GNAT family N-acetyltransferase [Lachnospiraceae bacterium]